MLDQAATLRKLMEEKDKKGTRIITITSGKGGVGKSNFTVNLGIVLSREGKRVLILDGDLGMGNDDLLMGIIARRSIFSCLKNNIPLEEAMAEGPYGLKLLPGGSGINQVEDLSETERKSLLESLKNLQDFDYILVDTGAGINRTVLAFISLSHEVFVVTTPEITSLTDAYSLMKAVSHFNLKDSLKVVVNKALSLREGEATYRKIRETSNRFLKLHISYGGTIKDDTALTKAVRSQRPLVLEFPSSEAAKNIEAIAKGLLGEKEVKENKGVYDLFTKLFKIFS